MTTPFILTHVYDNGTIRTLTVTTVNFSDGDVATITTEEDGDIVISLADTPDLWTQLTAES